ncbi:MAG: Ig-like domain-containing protein [Clostridia bacterium]|nr:Ig-like domain-containing protein [Clostridia bacterium]
MKKLFLSLLIIFALTMALVGCRQPQSEQDASTQTSVESEYSTEKGSSSDITDTNTDSNTSSNTQSSADTSTESDVSETATDSNTTSTDTTTSSGTHTDTPDTPTKVLVSTITLSADKTAINVGDSVTVTAQVRPDNAENKSVKWSVSSGSDFVSVSSAGVVTAKKAGTAKIRATANDGSGKYGEISVTVKAKGTWEGSGTESDPYLIRTLEDLKNLTQVVNKTGYHFKQVADIDTASVANWVIIGNGDNPFRHNYDGNGYTISNLCLDGDAQGLFTWVEDSHFKNIKIVNAHTKANHYTVEHNTAIQPGTDGYTGAIVGHGSGCSFENCSATVNFQSSNSPTGGLVGHVVLKNEKYALMKNCHVSGKVTGSGYLGGLIGSIHDYLTDDEYKPAHTITVENCSADVEIIIFTASRETPCVGGLIGEAFGVKIEKCNTTGSINVISGDIGGLVGKAGNYTDITRCSAKVDIYASSDNHYGGVSIGGLIGHIYSRSDVYDCYATGNISAPNVGWSPCQDSTNRNGGPWRRYYNPCGSLIGTLEVFKAYSEDEKITVYNCYATGKVNVPNICEDKRVYCHGALIGLVLDRNTVLNYNIKDTGKKELTWDDFKEYYIGPFGNNYNLENLRTYYEPINEYEGANVLGLQNPKYSKLPTHEFVKIITEAQLTDQSVFEGWDFVNIWKMGENGPTLR